MSRNQQILDAINAVRTHVRWKPDREADHLQKRIKRGHLPPGSTIRDYEVIILTVLKNRSADVYLYWYNLVPYVTVVSKVNDLHWLVMFNYDGIMESAFVVERPERYLSKPGFERIGLLGELGNEK